VFLVDRLDQCYLLKGGFIPLSQFYAGYKDGFISREGLGHVLA